MDQAPDLRTELFAGLDWYAQVVEGVRPEQLNNPTPCVDLPVRQLLTHMSTVLDKLLAFAQIHRDPYSADDRQPERLAQLMETLATERIDGISPAAQAESLRAQIATARQAWTDGILDTPIHLGWGPVLPGRVVSGIYLMEVLAHAWDLATATGQPSEAPTAVAQAGLAAARRVLPQEPRGIENGVPFGPVVTAAADAGPTEQLVNWTGRPSR